MRFSLSFIVVFARPVILKEGSPLKNDDSTVTISKESLKVAHFKDFILIFLLTFFYTLLKIFSFGYS